MGHGGTLMKLSSRSLLQGGGKTSIRFVEVQHKEHGLKTVKTG